MKLNYFWATLGFLQAQGVPFDPVWNHPDLKASDSTAAAKSRNECNGWEYFSFPAPPKSGTEGVVFVEDE